MALIHFDAHTDTWPDEDPKSLNHGTMFRRAINEGLVDPRRSVQVGIRTYNDDTMGVTVLDAPFVHENGEAAVIARIREIVGDAPAYLTFDIDCLDPAFAPGTGTPVCGGLSSAQVRAVPYGVARGAVCAPYSALPVGAAHPARAGQYPLGRRGRG
jgi:agmatinase